VIIPGNHDSAGRLSFASRLLESKGLHLAGSLERMAALDFQDKHGKVTIFPIPYAVPAEIDGASCHDDALAEQVRRLRSGRKLGRSVALAHCFVAGGTVSESERELCVGGSGQVRKENFDSFSYAALGHLHAPQTISSEKIRYSGSLFKYSFSEAGHKKGVVCVDMDANGGVTAEFMPLRPKRDLRRLRGQFKDLLIGKGDSGSKSDYIEFTLLDRGPVLDAMGRLRETYPNALHVRREADFWVPQEGPGKVDPARVDPVVLFSNFLKDTTNEPLSPKERPIFVEALKAALASEEGVE
jgi:exonuclease SbcD